MFVLYVTNSLHKYSNVFVLDTYPGTWFDVYEVYDYWDSKIGRNNGVVLGYVHDTSDLSPGELMDLEEMYNNSTYEPLSFRDEL